MQISSFSLHGLSYSHASSLARPARLRRLARILGVIAFLVALPVAAWGAPTATTTTLTTGSKTVNTHTITTLTSTVSAGATAVTQGLVQFYDGKVLLGTAQIVKTGTKYTHGAAYLAAELGAGPHSLKAVFAGTATYASSSSSANVTIAGGTTATSISSSGTQGNYTLTGTVIAKGVAPVTGNVEFIDETDSNAIVGTAALGTATAAQNFATAAPYSLYASTGNDSPQQAVAVDLNGDGILDMVAVEYAAAVISVYLGNGDGTFQAGKSFCMDTSQSPAVPCYAGSELMAITVADVNSDGIPDLVWVDSSTAYVALGNGDGTFQKPGQFQTQGDNTQVAVADLNRDGTPDVIASIDGGISILLGNGDGTLQAHTDIALNDASTYITIGDFNKDGIPDIASAGWNGNTLMILLGKGDGTFQAEKDTIIDINTAGCNVAAVDFKGAGYLSDIALCGSGELEALLGKGDGTFNAPQVLHPNGTFDEYVNWVAPVDVNGDGNIDLALAWDSSDTDVGRIGIFTGNGDGTFNATPTTVVTGKEPVFVTSGDLDGNGAPDLVTVNDTDDNVSVLLNSSSSTAVATLSNVAIPGTGSQSVVAQYQGSTAYATSTSSAISLTGGGSTIPPVISSLSPTTTTMGGPAFTLTVNGSGFASGAVVKWNGAARTTAFVSATKLSASIQASDIAVMGTFPVTATVGTQTSNAVDFAVAPASLPTMGPTIGSVSPNSAPVGSPAITIQVKGMNFIKGMMGSAVYWNGAQLATTYTNATTLTANVPAADLAAAGTFQVTVMNPGGAASNALPFYVTGSSTHMALAYGFFNKDGSSGSTSGNISCTWSTTNSYYQCAITGETFYYSKYVVSATIADINTIGTIGVNSLSGQVILKIYNSSGTAIQAPFYLAVFKP